LSFEKRGFELKAFIAGKGDHPEGAIMARWRAET
jgi:hypothetical protein